MLRVNVPHYKFMVRECAREVYVTIECALAQSVTSFRANARILMLPGLTDG